MEINLTEMTGKQVHKALIDEKKYKDKIKTLGDKVKLLEGEKKKDKQYADHLEIRLELEKKEIDRLRQVISDIHSE